MYRHILSLPDALPCGAAKGKSDVLYSAPATVTVAVLGPYCSCHASMGYVPGGSPRRLKLPSVPLTAKKPCATTPAYEFIHPCTLHSSVTMTSGDRKSTRLNSSH